MNPLSINTREIDRLERDLTKVAPRLLERTARTSLLRTRRASRTQAGRAIRTLYNVKQGRVVKGMRLGAINISDLSFKIIGSNDQLTIRNFGARQTARGVTAKILKASNRTLFRASFEATGLGGNRLFFTRLNRHGNPLPIAKVTQGKYKGQNRQKIRALLGPSVADMLDNEPVASHLADFAEERFITEYTRQFRRILAR